MNHATSDGNVRQLIMSQLATHFSNHHLWNVMEAELAIKASDLPAPTNEQKKQQLINSLYDIKHYLEQKDIPKKELRFLEREIDRYQNTKQISLYSEEDESIDPDIAESYAKLGYGSEGIVGIHVPWNYEQLKKLTNYVYKQTGLVKFFVSRQTTINGKIVQAVYERAQTIPIATLLLKKQSKEQYVSLFGQKYNGKNYEVVKEIPAQFYIYKFISDKDQEMYLLSTVPQEIGDYYVTGMTVVVDDHKNITQSQRLHTKMPYMFVQQCRNRISKYDNSKEFKKKMEQLEFHGENAWNHPFVVKNGNDARLLVQPEWFKWLVWSWILHAPVGFLNKYPLHILIFGPKGTGKSWLLNCLYRISNENRQIFSGSGSTLKSLIPSFKQTPPQVGYLAESNRFSFLDEFLRCISSIRDGVSSKSDTKEESVAVMNDLLEHQRREAGSGMGRVNVNMTARVLATTNPIKGRDNVTDLFDILDHSFLSRWLIYYQTEDHIKTIQNITPAELKRIKYDIHNDDWISIVDFMQSFTSEYSMARVREIFEANKEILPETLLSNYEARHLHHIQCVIDGIIKTRCLINNTIQYTAIDEDYKRLEQVWNRIVASWINGDAVRKMDVDVKIKFLPEDCQYVMGELEKERAMTGKSHIPRVRTKDLALKGIDSRRYVTAMIILRDQGLIEERGDSIYLCTKRK